MRLPAHKIGKRNQFFIASGSKKIYKLVSSFLAYQVILWIKVYQKYLSPLLVSSCRFYPSCSNYALESYQKYGLLSGSMLTIKRLCKCHPFHPGGLDEVPLKDINTNYKEDD